MLTEDEVLKELPYWLNDLYHAVRINTLHGEDIRYCSKLGGFS